MFNSSFANILNCVSWVVIILVTTFVILESQDQHSRITQANIYFSQVFDHEEPFSEFYISRMSKSIRNESLRRSDLNKYNLRNLSLVKTYKSELNNIQSAYTSYEIKRITNRLQNIKWKSFIDQEDIEYNDNRFMPESYMAPKLLILNNQKNYLQFQTNAKYSDLANYFLKKVARDCSSTPLEFDIIPHWISGPSVQLGEKAIGRFFIGANENFFARTDYGNIDYLKLDDFVVKVNGITLEQNEEGIFQWSNTQYKKGLNEYLVEGLWKSHPNISYSQRFKYYVR